MHPCPLKDIKIILWKCVPGLSQTYPCSYPSADLALYAVTITKLSYEYDYMLSTVSPPCIIELKNGLGETPDSNTT